MVADSKPTGPKTYPDVKALLARLLAGARSVLGGDLVGLYLHGSLAAGGFDPEVSAVDCLVAPAGPLCEETVANLASGRVHASPRRHARLHPLRVDACPSEGVRYPSGDQSI